MGDARNGGSTMWRLPLALAGALACHGALAQADVMQTDGSAVQPAGSPTARLELATSNLPRFDAVDPGVPGGQRIDLTLLPPRRSAIGLAVGMTGFTAQPATSGAGLGGSAPAPAVDVGLHWRHTLDSNYRLDITAWRRVPQQPADTLEAALQRGPTYGARVELNLSPQSKRKFASDRGFIGMQLDNGGRISIRRKHGGPMIYYRNTF